MTIRLPLLVAVTIAAIGPPPQDFANALDALMAREMASRHIPGAAVAVIEHGQVTLARAYGVLNLETLTPLTTDGVFELASVTKPFTASAIMLLVEAGRIDLDAPIAAYLGDTPPAWAGITVRHLLTHTSGLDQISVPRVQGAVPLVITTAQMFAYLREQPLRWPVGTHGWYSDAGYFLLGMILERAAGQSYRDFMQQRVFHPLQMRDTSILDKARVLERRVSTYSWRDGRHFNWRRDWDYELPSFFGIFSTLRDLAAWDRALRSDTWLRADSRRQMWTPATFANGLPVRVQDDLHGFGWHLFDVRGHRAAGHSGASGTYYLHFLDQPLSIIVLTNLDGTSGRHHWLLARSIAGLARPALQPPHELSAGAEAAPGDAAIVEQLLRDISARRPSAVMSARYRSWYEASPGWRAWAANQVGGAIRLRFLARDDLGGRTLWATGDPLARLVHFAADVKGRMMFLSIGLTADDRVAQFDFYGN